MSTDGILTELRKVVYTMTEPLSVSELRAKISDDNQEAFRECLVDMIDRRELEVMLDWKVMRPNHG